MNTDEVRPAAWGQIPELLDVRADGLVSSGLLRKRVVVLELPLD